MLGRSYLLPLLVLLFSACSVKEQKQADFIRVENGQFMRYGKPYYFIGVNYWYGALLGSPGKEGDRKRLLRELNLMKAHGIDNLRVLAGAEGPDGEPRRVSPALQTEPGVYNDSILEGLDFLLAEMAKRDMVAVLYLNNAWEWSGGFAQYLNWNGFGPIPYPEVNATWQEFMSFSGLFNTCLPCQEQYFQHLKFMLTRTNRFTGLTYNTDPTIMTWELANEPRAFSDENKTALHEWVNKTARYIKELAPDQLVTTGTEGSWGCENDLALFEQIHTSPDVDYLTMHIWPYNWSWLKPNDMKGTIESAIEKANIYMDEHIAVAQKLNKPIVFEEFGLPRDGFVFKPGSPVTLRDQYFSFAFEKVLIHAKKGGVMAGANFWTFSGEGLPIPDREKNMWQPGDPFLGDPPQEAQGLNSVFKEDPTMAIVKSYNKKLKGVGYY